MTFFSRQKIGMVAAVIATLAATAPATAMGDAKKGGEVYESTCIACHGENGKGEFPGVPDFTSSNGPLTKTNTVLLDHIMNGFQSPNADMAMPALGGNEALTELDILNVIAYLRATF